MKAKEIAKTVWDYAQQLIPTRFYVKNLGMTRKAFEDVGIPWSDEDEHVFRRLGQVVEVGRGVGAPGAMLLAKLEYGTALANNIDFGIAEYSTVSMFMITVLGLVRHAIRHGSPGLDNEGLEQIVVPNNNGI